MGQGDITTIREQATKEMTTITPPLPPSPNTTNMTENLRNNASQADGSNASQTSKSIVNQIGEAAQTFVNKMASVLGNITGEVSQLFGGADKSWELNRASRYVISDIKDRRKA